MRNQFVNKPMPNVLSLMPKDENFADTREEIRGAWISDEAWENINTIFSQATNDEAIETGNEIREENPVRDEGVFLTDKHFDVIEKNLAEQLPAIKKANQTTTEKWTEINQTPYLRAIAAAAQRKRENKLK